jgi:hypothetical protein
MFRTKNVSDKKMFWTKNVSDNTSQRHVPQGQEVGLCVDGAAAADVGNGLVAGDLHL